MSAPSPSHTLVYDGDCRVCTRLVGAVDVLDREHRVERLSSRVTGARERFPWIPAGSFDDALQLVATDGTTWSGAAAIEELLRVLPRGRWLAWTFALPFARPVAERFYRWFARNRYRLGCGEHCRGERATS